MNHTNINVNSHGASASDLFSNSTCFSCDFPFVNVNFEAKARNPKNVAAGRGVRELSESNRCLKNRVVRDLLREHLPNIVAGSSDFC